MRATSFLLKGPGRAPAKEPVPFVEILPLRLKDTVSGKSNRQAENICLQELGLLLSCLKKHDFNQTSCDKEINAFKNCHKTVMAGKKIIYEQEKRGELKTGTKDLSSKQINKILKQYPLV
ncbi:hypothetical protein R5R35_000850 [Gryllus longicercus]|uniref:Coiled-coil-helix-coiled-coil-helix domain-containing protein 1 n=1 Tax=Gryllus longicercus TaxID=2509291 RepID=A0AAN9VKD5_9ORTH